MSMRRLIAALLVLLSVAVPGQADDLRPGYLELTQTSATTWRMIWKAPLKGGLATAATPLLPAFCTRSNEHRELAGGALVTGWTVTCSGSLAGRKVGLAGLDRTFTDALVRIAPLGETVQAARLTPDRPTIDVLAKPDRGQVAKTYFVLGVEHILFGFDHLLFVLALVLLLRGGWLIAKTVTAFTVAHSLTLIGTTLGWVSVSRAPVESVIALSIIFLAVEIVKVRADRKRLSERFPWIVAFAFGLLHGFGFAGALAEIGLPQGEVPVALLTFNLGVEAGQLIIVGAALGVLAALRKVATAAVRPAQLAAAYGIGIVASFWFIERTLA